MTHPTHLTTAQCNLRDALTVTQGRAPLSHRDAVIGGVICWLFGAVSATWFIAIVIIGP